MDLGDAHRMGSRLLEQHGLGHWTLRFDRAKRRAGVCRHRDRVIGLSAPLTRLHDEGEVRDTVLHEIAHALVGPTEAHGPRWRATALRIGCSGQRCVPEDAPRVVGDWVGTCPGGHTTERHRRPEKVVSCSRCSKAFALEHAFEWTFRGEPVPMHPTYVAHLAALRSGSRQDRVREGDRVRIVVPGRWHGTVGPVLKVGRTRYHVAAGGAVVTVPMVAVEPVG